MTSWLPCFSDLSIVLHGYVPGLTLCGDSVFPGIGVPAVAASGCIAANNLVPFWKHLQLVRSIRMP
jgi:hypothetical protein